MIRRIWMVASALLVTLLASPIVAMAGTVVTNAPLPGEATGIGIKAGLLAIGAGVGIGIAALGCGIGQGKLGASAMESIGRNPNSTNQLFVPMIIGLAFIESLTLYALVIAFILQAKI